MLLYRLIAAALGPADQIIKSRATFFPSVNSEDRYEIRDISNLFKSFLKICTLKGRLTSRKNVF